MGWGGVIGTGGQSTVGKTAADLDQLSDLDVRCTHQNYIAPSCKGSLSLRKRMNFRKISERGEGGVISDLKNFIAIFFAL